jgi:hypothetical protein
MITQYSVVLCSGQPGCSLSRSLANYCRMRVNPPNSPTAYRGTHTALGAMNVSGLTHFCATDTKVFPVAVKISESCTLSCAPGFSEHNKN